MALLPATLPVTVTLAGEVDERILMVWPLRVATVASVFAGRFSLYVRLVMTW